MSDLDYDTVTQALQRINIPADAAELHGAISAMVCTLGESGKPHWLAALLPELAQAVASGDALAGETQRLLEELFQQTARQLAGGEFNYTPMLPDDDQNLSARATALGHWCQGFLLGLQAGGVADAMRLPMELAEIYQDFAEISQITATELAAEGEDEDEEAYAELYEYLKVGAMLFYEEFHSGAPQVESPAGLH